MPKTNTPISIEPETARQLVEYAEHDLRDWCERVAHAPSSDRVGELLRELLPILEGRDATIDAVSSGTLDRALYVKYASELLTEVRGELPEMDVPEGTLNYHAARAMAAARAEHTLAAIAA